MMMEDRLHDEEKMGSVQHPYLHHQVVHRHWSDFPVDFLSHSLVQLLCHGLAV